LILIYSHKPQRSGRGISTNTNNPPQDPPPPHEEKKIPPVVDEQPKVTLPSPEITIPEKIIVTHEKPSVEVPDIPIEDTTPPVPEECQEEKLILSKATLIRKPIPESKVTVTTEIKTKKQTKTEPKISWFRRFISRIKKFFRRE
jgi:hypothetical protein